MFEYHEIVYDLSYSKKCNSHTSSDKMFADII